MTELVEYYHEIYGPPSREAEFISQQGIKIRIFKWDEDRTDEGVSIYLTLGASSVLGDSSDVCEFFIGLTPSVDSIAGALAEVAIHGNGTNSIPSSGDTVTLAYELWAGTKMKSFMFTDGDEIIPPVEISDGKLVSFIQLVPLFDSELSFKKMNGEDLLWDKFEVKEIPYWNASRSDSKL